MTDEEEAPTWIGLAQSLLGIGAALVYVIVPAMLAIEVPEWPGPALFVFALVPHVDRFERVSSAVGKLLEKAEDIIKAARGFDPRTSGPKDRSLSDD